MIPPNPPNEETLAIIHDTILKLISDAKNADLGVKELEDWRQYLMMKWKSTNSKYHYVYLQGVNKDKKDIQPADLVKAYRAMMKVTPTTGLRDCKYIVDESIEKGDCLTTTLVGSYLSLDFAKEIMKVLEEAGCKVIIKP